MDFLSYLGLACAVIVTILVAVAAAGVGNGALERPARISLLVLEAVAAVVVVASLGTMLGGEEPPSRVTHVGYMIAAVGVIPLLMMRPVPPDTEGPGGSEGADGGTAPEVERTPPSLWVGALAALVVAVVLWRLAVTA